MDDRPIAVTLPRELLEAIDRITRRRGPSRAVLIRAACEQYVHRFDENRRHREWLRRADRDYAKAYLRHGEVDWAADDWSEHYEAEVVAPLPS